VEKYLPSTIWILAVAMPVVALGMITALFYVLHGNTNTTSPNEIAAFETTPENLAIIATVTEKDSDNDGLRDWEETLWNTDPLKADSDADGTSDHDEIERGRDPLNSAPNDVYTLTTTATQATTPSASSTLTDRASRDLFTGYLLLRQGNNLDPASIQDLVTGVVNRSSDSARNTAQKYTADDLLRVVQDPGSDAMIAYSEGLRQSTAHLRGLENEFIVFQRILREPAEADIEKLAQAALQYNTASAQLLALEVPSAVLTPHMRLVNGFSEYGQMVESMAGFASDPMRTMVILNEYMRLVTQMREATSEILQYIQE
jgi:hypothetical protein